MGTLQKIADQLTSSSAQSSAQTEQAREELSQKITDIVEAHRQSVVDFNAVKLAIQNGRSETVSSIQQNGVEIQRLCGMVQEHKDATDLTPLMQEVQNTKAALDFEAVHGALAQKTFEIDNSTNAIMK